MRDAKHKQQWNYLQNLVSSLNVDLLLRHNLQHVEVTVDIWWWAASKTHSICLGERLGSFQLISYVHEYAAAMQIDVYWNFFL